MNLRFCFVGSKYPRKYLPTDEYERPAKVLERKHDVTFTNNQKQELYLSDVSPLESYEKHCILLKITFEITLSFIKDVCVASNITKMVNVFPT